MSCCEPCSLLGCWWGSQSCCLDGSLLLELFSIVPALIFLWLDLMMYFWSEKYINT